MLAYVWDSKKNDAKRRVYDTMVHLLNTTHEFSIKPDKKRKLLNFVVKYIRRM
jgi:hypothetical protein